MSEISNYEAQKKKLQGLCDERRTLPKSTYDSDMYNRAFPIGNALFLFI